jgi:glycosyltransferase involved in cell wall biosynthesis
VNALVVEAVATALDIPWVYEVRGQLMDTWASTRGPAALRSERYKLFSEREAEAAQSAGLVVTLGQSMKSRLISSGTRPDQILVSPNAVGDDFLTPPREPQAARAELGLTETGFFVGTVSSLVPYEGLETLVRAVALLAPDFPELRLLMVGDGVSRPSLAAVARDEGISDRVILTGRVPRNVAHLYHQALDVFVVPRDDLDVTRSVTPLKPVEAMASARPVVASDLPALRETVLDGVTGKLFAAGDWRALAEQLRLYLENQNLRESHGWAGRQAVLASRTWGKNAEAYIAAYENLWERPEGREPSDEVRPAG